MEVFYDDTDEHVEDEESNEEKEGDKIDETPLIVVLYWLKVKQMQNVQYSIHYLFIVLFFFSSRWRNDGNCVIVS